MHCECCITLAQPTDASYSRGIKASGAENQASTEAASSFQSRRQLHRNYDKSIYEQELSAKKTLFVKEKELPKKNESQFVRHNPIPHFFAHHRCLNRKRKDLLVRM